MRGAANRTSRRRDLDCIAVTRPGLEHVCAAELRDLGLRVERIEAAAVAFGAPDRGLYVAVRWSRVATRILVVAARFRAHAFGSLERGLAEVPWEAWISAGVPVEVRARSHQARLFHTGAIAERVHLALAEAGLGTAAEDERRRRDAWAGVLDEPREGGAGTSAADGGAGGDDAARGGTAVARAGAALVSRPRGSRAQRVDVRIVGERAEVRIDATGNPGDRRGWRRALAKAPLPPTVAAAALRSAGWRPDVALLDAMCGSGTIPIEAALWAAGRAPGVDCTYAVQSWPTFAPGTWASAAATPPSLRPATTPASPATNAPILASDRDEGASRATVGNAERAGVADRVAVSALALSAAAGAIPEGTPPGLVLLNPPWGRRIDGGGDLRDLYAAVGRLLVALPGWRLGLITADDRLAGHVGIPLEAAWRTRVAGETVTLHLSAPT